MFNEGFSLSPIYDPRTNTPAGKESFKNRNEKKGENTRQKTSNNKTFLLSHLYFNFLLIEIQGERLEMKRKICKKQNCNPISPLPYLV